MYRVIYRNADTGEIRTIEYNSKRAAMVFFQHLCGNRVCANAIVQKAPNPGGLFDTIANFCVTPHHDVLLAR